MPPSIAPSTQLSSSTPNRDVDAYVSPPIGWLAEPLKHTSRHSHQVWISPSGFTAYGVIRSSLPLPVGYDLVLWGFMNEMKKSEGEATLISKEWDANLDALRFVAEGGKYRLRANLVVDGWQAWAVYAGTLRDHAVMEDELELAEIAREHTAVGIGAANR
ncbi:hypothetical protein BH09PLA1_BH09PLA1_09410 [soil metagenome]